ncbi:MAG: type II secretion system F family protein [Planctomycetota bacterium]
MAAYSIDFLQRLRSLLASGVPVRDAFQSLVETGGASGRLASDIARRLEEGASLGEALSNQRQIPLHHQALFRAGEASGRLVEILDSVIRDTEDIRDVRRVLMQQVAYPVAVLSTALLLPPIAITTVVGKAPPGAMTSILAFFVLAALGVLVWRGPGIIPRGNAVRRFIESTVLALPFLRNVVVDAIFGRAFDLCSQLLGAGLSFDETLALVRDCVDWDHYRAPFDSARDAIRGGGNAVDAFSRLPGLRADVLQRISSGAQAGRLDEELGRIGKESRERYLHKLQVTLRVLPIVFYLFAMIVILQQGLAAFSSAGI